MMKAIKAGLIVLTVFFSLFIVTADGAIGSEQIVVNHELGVTTVPKNPERVIVFDFGVLDSMHALGIDIIALPKDNIPSYLSHYNDAEYVHVGSLKEPDFERIYSLKPDLIIISGRQSTLYDELSKIGPMVYMGLDTSRYMSSFEENVRMLGKIFDMEASVEEELETINEKIDELREKVKGINNTALITLVNDRMVSAYGPGSRFGLIHDVFGFAPVDRQIDVSNHGQTISFEYILTKDPEYMFVIDRTQVIDGRSSAKAVIENQLVRFTKAYKNDHIVYLDPEYWYLSGGGLVSVDAMIDEIAAAIE